MARKFLTNVDLNNNDATNVDSLSLNTATTDTPAAGKIVWDDGEGTATLGLKGGNVNISIGQNNVVRCYNGTGSTIAKGSVVYISGAQGQRPSISLADADSEATSSKTLGLAAESIANGAEGTVTTFGILTGLDTSAYTAGQSVWLSSTAGAFTTTQAVPPAHLVFIGYIISINASSGRMFVNPQNGYELGELHNVLLDAGGSIADNEVLAWDSSSSLWKNQTAAEAGLIDTSSTAQTKTGNFTSSGDIAAGGVLKSTASSANEGGQIELSVPSSGTTLSGTNVTIDIYQDKLRFFESGGTNRGAYIPLTSTGAAVGTSLLGGTTGAMNYAQTKGTKQSNISTAGTTIVSVSFTTNGYPVQVLVTGDVENNSAGGWTTLQLYRDSTAIGNIIHTEGSAGSENAPFSLTTIDTPAAGTYTYALKLNSASGGTFNFGESNGPVITVVELSGPKGDTGATGAAGTSPNAFTTIATTSGTSPVADSTSDTLTLSAGTGITVTGDSTTDTVTIAVASNTYQPLDSELTAIAGLTSAADRLPYFTGSGTASLATFTSFARTLLDDTDAATARGTLGVPKITLSDTAPSSPVTGDFWFESDTGEMFTYYDSSWVSVAPQGPQGPQGVQGATGVGSVVPMVSGYYYTSATNNSNVNATNNVAYYIPFFVDQTTTFDRIACRTGGSFSGSGVVRLGIYNDTQGLPSTLVLDAGTVATTVTNSPHEITINQTLSAGIYWLVFVSQTAATTNNFRTSATPYFQQTVGTTAAGGAVITGWQQSSVTGALGSSAGTLLTSTNSPTTYLRKA